MNRRRRDAVDGDRPIKEKHYIAVSSSAGIFQGICGPFVSIRGILLVLGRPVRTWAVDHDGKRIERAYSIVSSPYGKAWSSSWNLSARRVDAQAVQLQKGDTMLCRKIARGGFTLDLRSGRTNLCS